MYIAGQHMGNTLTNTCGCTLYLSACRQRYDISFVLDLSGSIEVLSQISMYFVGQVVQCVEFRFDTVRAALVSYSDEARVNFLLNTYTVRRSLFALVYGSKLER